MGLALGAHSNLALQQVSSHANPCIKKCTAGEQRYDHNPVTSHNKRGQAPTRPVCGYRGGHKKHCGVAHCSSVASQVAHQPTSHHSQRGKWLRSAHHATNGPAQEWSRSQGLVAGWSYTGSTLSHCAGSGCATTTTTAHQLLHTPRWDTPAYVGCKAEPHTRKPACAAHHFTASMQECRRLALGCLMNSACCSMRQTPVQQVGHTSLQHAGVGSYGDKNSKHLGSLPQHKWVRGQAPQTMPAASAASALPNNTSALPTRCLPCTARHPITQAHTSAQQLPGYKRTTSGLTQPHKHTHSLSCTPHISTAAQGGPPARNSRVQLPHTQKLRRTLLTAMWACQILTSM